MDNCLSWAARRWQAEEGYLVIRWCRSNKLPFVRWPHFAWLAAEHHDKLKHFMPRDQSMGKHYLPDLWFDGRIQTGDPPDEDGEN